MPRTYRIETFGCQMNVHDSERMAGQLELAGFRRAGSEEAADLIVLNTCSVRGRAEEKVYSRLGELQREARRQGLSPTFAVAGCVAQQEGPALLARAPFVQVIVGPQAARHLARLVGQAERTGKPVVDISRHEDESFPLGVVRRDDRLRAAITIMEGCSEGCAFCVVPFTRGAERMRSSAEIVAEVREAIDRGHKEIQLLGQIVNRYGAPDDPTCDFAELLARINDVAGVERIRFASPHPRYVTPRLIQAIRDLPRVCKHLHLPVQSGSSRILLAMRRRHTREQYIELIDAVRASVPAITLSTDIIVGFPGESEEDFAETLSLLDRVRYHSAFSFKYSPRPNTFAINALHDTVPPEVKRARLLELQARQREIQQDLLNREVGTVASVLLDSTSRRSARELCGRTTGNIVVNVPGSSDLLGRTVAVCIRRAGPNSLWGEICATPA